LTAITKKESSGKGSKQVLDVLRSAFPDVVVEDDDQETIPIEETDWYQRMKAQSTPGKALRVYRKNAGLTQDALAERSGIAKSHISAMENDKRPLGRITARKLAQAPGCDYRSLL